MEQGREERGGYRRLTRRQPGETDCRESRMGKFIDFDQAPHQEHGSGIRIAPITGGEGEKMAAELITVARGAKLESSVPSGSDRHLFVLSGEALLDAPALRGKTMSSSAFASLQEDTAFTVTGKATESRLLSVTAPPPGTRSAAPGFRQGVRVVSIHEVPAVDVPQSRKKRVFLATRDTIGSERAHGMIVKYRQDTETTMHMHPDAESLFVFLEGRTRVTVNGTAHAAGFGQAAFFPCGDRHSLHGVDAAGSSFLEFHIPGVYTTVR